MRAGVWEYTCNCTFAAALEHACLYVCLRLCFYTNVGLSPALTAHHRAPVERYCISASLGLSLRSSERLDPAGSGLGPENREAGERIGTEEEVKQELRSKG